MWSREVAERYWSGKRAYEPARRKEGTMRYYVMNRESARFFEKADGSRVWNLSRDEAMQMSNFAVVVALDERNFNESLNVYMNERLFKQAHYDERLGWVS